jgi:hypothetical protein
MTNRFDIETNQPSLCAFLISCQLQPQLLDKDKYWNTYRTIIGNWNNMKQVSTNSTYTMRSVRFYVISMLPLISGWRELAQLSYEYVKQKPAMLELSGIPPDIGWGKNML